MLVNLKEFNNRLAAHGSDSKLQLSITGYYIAHIKTNGRNTTSHTHVHRTTNTAKPKYTQRLVQTQMCSRCAPSP